MDVAQLSEEPISRCFRADGCCAVYFMLHLDEELCVLRRELPKIQEVIWYAERKPETVEMSRGLKGFVEDAEDILDEHFYTQIAQRGGSNQVAARQKNKFKMPTVKVCRLIQSRLRFANKIKKLYDKLERLKTDLDERRRFVASVMEGLRLTQREDDQLPRRPITDELLSRNFCLVGREEIKKKVVAELLSEFFSKPSVILITGIGGVGKTTLVQDIFRDEGIDTHFQIRRWVCVGDDELDPKAVMTEYFKRNIENRNEIISKLKGRRYLIALDECSIGKLRRWKELWELLRHGSNGSKVIITSRVDITKELETAASVKKYELDILSNRECLEIFEAYAFPYKEPSSSSHTSRLGEIEKEILNEEIRGLPLLAMFFGSLLWDVGRERWINMLRGDVENDIMSVYMRSYQHLPWYLKRCLAYLLLFPKDYMLEKELVVWMWMAQDYVYYNYDRMTLEDSGKVYFDLLVSAIFIKKMQDNKDSDACYNMTNLVHYFVTNVFRDGCMPNNAVAQDNYVPSRHLLIDDNNYSSKQHLYNNKKLRTLLFFCKHADIEKFQLQHVRVLSLSHEQHLAKVNFEKMVHLRYLDLTKVKSGTLSESICGMYNLQTLLLNDRVENFPVGAWNLPKLRHLKGGKHLRMTGISNSTSLQRLDNFNLLTEGGGDIGELGNLKELHGKLEINHLGLLKSKQSTSKARLDDKVHIEELVLNWDSTWRRNQEHNEGIRELVLNWYSTWRRNPEHNEVLEELCPHGSDLRTLEIRCYMGDQFPTWMQDKHLPNLVELRLIRLHHIKELPPLGLLPKLEQLHLWDLRNVRCIVRRSDGTKAYEFPSLKVLVLNSMVRLEEWMESTSKKISTCFPSLEHLNIAFCKRLRTFPRLPGHLKRLYIFETGLWALPNMESTSTSSSQPKMWSTSSSQPEMVSTSSEDDILRLEELIIHGCPSLCPDEWFRRYRMPSLSKLQISSVDCCTDLVVNHSRKCLTSVYVAHMRKLEKFTLSNITPVNEFREADYRKLSVELGRLDALTEVSVANREDGKITAGPLHLTALGRKMLQGNVSKFALGQDYNNTNAVVPSGDLVLRADGGTDLVIDCYREQLTSLDIRNTSALRSITLSNAVPVNEAREADHQRLRIQIGKSDAMDDDVSTVDRDIDARGRDRASTALQKLSETMKLDEEYAVKNNVRYDRRDDELVVVPSQGFRARAKSTV